MTDYKNLEHPRVLIVAMSGIGNLLMQTPLIKRLKVTNPAAEISVLVAPRGTRDVLTQNPYIKNIFLGDPKPSFRKRIGMVQTLQKEHFDIGIVAFPGQLTMSSSLLFFGSVKKRIGHAYDYHFLKNSGLFLTQKVARKNVHDVRQNLNLLEPLGINFSADGTEYDFPLTDDDRRTATNFTDECKISGSELIGLHPGTHEDMTYKRWPIERWARLADMLADAHKSKILIFGGPDENRLKAEVAKLMRHKPYGVTLPLRGTAALIGKCKLFVSNDSGLMHVAVSQKVSTFGLFGPTDEGRTAPWGKFGHVIRGEGTKPNYDVAKLREISKQQKPDDSLLALGVDNVFRKITNC